jgi:hypothetical protein
MRIAVRRNTAGGTRIYIPFAPDKAEEIDRFRAVVSARRADIQR